MHVLRGIIGIAILVGIGYVLSENKKKIDWKLIGTAILAQLILAFLAFKTKYIALFFDFASKIFIKVYDMSLVGSRFMFGNLENLEGPWGFVFAIKVLPSLVFFSALFSLLYYLRILPLIINTLSYIFKKTLGISGAESLAAAGNIFLGQSETPLLIKPLLKNLTRSEMMSLITGGFATISGAILGSAVGILGESYASHLLIASVLSAPAAIMVAKLMVPEVEDISTFNYKLSKSDLKDGNALDAISTGTFDGLKLALNVGAMLIVFISLIALVNLILGKIGMVTGLNEILPYAKNGLSLEYIFGIILSPIAWVIGIESGDLIIVGQLIGEKTVINEFQAYTSMQKLVETGSYVHERSKIISTYALCGFSNFSSIGIMIGGITALAPEKRSLVAEMSIRALIGGTIACLMTATIAGMFF